MQSQLILLCLRLTGEANINVINTTCDGCPANITTLKKLGANIPTGTYFRHPVMDHNVCHSGCCAYDQACHLRRGDVKV